MFIKNALFGCMLFLISSCGNNPAANEQPATTATTQDNEEDISTVEMFKAVDCGTCHRRTEAFSGPSFLQIAMRYPNAADTTIANLAGTIIKGSAGKWKDFVAAMTPHPNLSEPEAENMVKYILAVKTK